MTIESIAHGCVVLFHYTLTDEEGEIIDTSSGAEPMPYLHGFGNIVPGLERQMEGRKAGDKFTAIVPPAEGYGERNGEGPQAVPRSEMPPDMDPQPGMQLAAQLPDGNVIPLFVVDVDEEHVYLDDEHPLAGTTLHFAVEVMGIRAATEEEMTHGHPHGADGTEGHHHH